MDLRIKGKRTLVLNSEPASNMTNGLIRYDIGSIRGV
jgi:hypothetical protein